MSVEPCWAWKCPKGHLTTTVTPDPPMCAAPLIERGHAVGMCGENVEPYTLRRDWQ